ncbi:MAG: S9 family peptidase [Bryobacterales bacterium]|nr:S9 family peptidase [Bryobacterales bacterium]
MRVLGFLLCAAVAWAANGAKSPVNAADLLKIRRVTEVQVARDGSFAVYGVQSIRASGKKEDPRYRYETNLYSISLSIQHAPPRQLTFGNRADRALALSPDGKWLAFERPDEETKRSQIWLLPLEGGEAQPVTSLEFGAASPVWKPDSKELLVLSQVPLSRLDEKPAFSQDRPARDWFDFDRAKAGAEPLDARPDGDRRAIRNWLERNAAEDNPSVITRLAFQNETGLDKEMRLPRWYSVTVDGSRAPRLVSQLAGPCAWSPDGGRIACAGAASAKDHPDRNRRTAIYVMDADGSNLRPVANKESESYTDPHFTADGRTLILKATATDEPTYRQTQLVQLQLANQRFSTLGEWAGSVGDAVLASDGSVLFTSAWHGGFPLKRFSGNAVMDVVPSPQGVTAFGEGGGRVVYARTAVENPNELYLRDKDGATRKLTDLNGWVDSKQLALPREQWITRPDGLKVQTWVMDPIGAEPGRKYPWVLDIHGGPHAMWGPGELSMWHEFQLLCAWGYGVVYSNPRGSGGYGYAFQKANYRNWGAGPAGDVLAALDEAVKSNPLVDSGRLFITGGSYAGYLTAWIIGHDHRFKAAAAQRGVYDLSTFFGEGNAFRLLAGDFGGWPYEGEMRRLLEAESPATYAAQIRTPLLILHGSSDMRTGVVQSEMLYRALKQQGKPVEYIRYPGAGHELTRSGDPRQRMDHVLRIIEFFERYSANAAPAPVER